MRRAPFPHRSLGLLVVAAIVVSGCAGKGNTAQNAAGPSGPQVVTADALSAREGSDFGEIVGRVLDEELRPLDEVLVRILSTKAETRTTADGIFYFSRVPARGYTIHFSKGGFEPQNKSVAVPGSQRVVVEAILKDIPDTSPYIDDAFVFRGRINCSVRANVSGTNTNPECGQTSPETDTQRRRYMDLLPDVGYLLVEVAWQNSIPVTNDRLTLALRPYQGSSWRQVQGASPIRILVTPDGFADMKKNFEKDYVAFGGQIELIMFPGEWTSQSGAAAGATFQQDFTIYGTAFYRTGPEPDYTRLPR